MAGNGPALFDEVEANITRSALSEPEKVLFWIWQLVGEWWKNNIPPEQPVHRFVVGQYPRLDGSHSNAK